MTGYRTSRRSVLLGGGGVLVGLTTGCGGGHRPAAGRSVRPSPTSTAAIGVDEATMTALAAAFEGLLVSAYATIRSRAADGAYGSLPGVVDEFLTAAASQHRQHAASWNRLRARASRPAVDGAALGSTAGVVAAATATSSVSSALTLLAGLESQAAATYLQLVGARVEQPTVSLAATIAPVEAQHGSVLAVLLGRPPVPAGLLTTAGAAKETGLARSELTQTQPAQTELAP